jgi:1-acyl-sn-glycerol-3-phosphate acyltransferase
MGPLLRDDSPRAERLRRRATTLARDGALLVVVTAALPLLVPAAAVVDAVRWLLRRTPFVGLRLLAVGWYFLFAQARALVLLLLLQARVLRRDTPARRRGVYRLRQQWLGGVFDVVVRAFGLRVEVEGLEEVAPGPVVVLCRHASIIDNAMPDAVIGRAHGMGLRFVIKRELAVLPGIDIGGRMVPTAFVRRGSGETARELEALRRLADTPGGDEGILIYPEGTRWTPAKLERAQEIVRERQPDVAELADRLRWLLPPRLGGPVELLRAAREADVVLCGHVGLDGFERISDIWSGGLVGGRVRIRFWRVPRSEVPSDEPALRRWIYERWLEVDDWIAAERAAGR